MMTFFEGARLIVGDGTEPMEGAGILVRDGRVTAAGPDIRAGAGDLRVDLAGKTVMPAIVNPHGHIGYFKGAVATKENFSRENVLDHLRRLAYYGVSVFQSLGTDRDDIELGIRDEQRAGTLDDPELALLLSAGNGLVAPTPGSDNGGPYFATDVIREVSTPAQARAVVRELVAKNPDVIKFWVDDRNGEKRKFGPEVYSAIIDEAHQHGKKAIAHIYELEDAKGVVRAGVDGTAHMVRAPGPDEELLRPSHCTWRHRRSAGASSSSSTTWAAHSSTGGRGGWSSRRWAPGWCPGRENCLRRSTTSPARSAGRPAAIRTSCWEPAPSRPR
jgi:imidazolonepropionase-like amidohydrolase